MNTESKIHWLLRLTAGAALVAIAAGCSTQTQKADGLEHGEQFLSQRRRTLGLTPFNTMEAANAAHADATPRGRITSTATSLNSLGEERLDLILRNGDTPAPLVIYLSTSPQGRRQDQQAPRRAVTAVFLKDRGLTDNQIVMKSGPEP